MYTGFMAFVLASFSKPLVLFGVSVVLFVFSLGLAVWVVYTERRLKRFFLGNNAASLETTMTDLVKTVQIVCHKQEETDKAIAEIRAMLQGSVKQVSVVRFNPFNDAGGDQSFSMALLDRDGTGAVVSSLYSREGVRVYGKPVAKGKSTYKLTEEELEAIKIVRER